ncbi:MAG: DUF1203 domain-containing protein [Pseudomonadota bacterium]
MDFQINPLSADVFAHLFELSDAELAQHKAVRQIVAAKPGTPCRVSMADAEVGETVILVNHQYQPGHSPYQATHAVYVRENAKEAQISVNEVPEVIASRLVSLRCFDRDHMMIWADVMAGEEVGSAISKAFEDESVAYAHIHNAKPGCFAASVTRVRG